MSRQAARGTTVPFTATAMPRWPVSTAFSAQQRCDGRGRQRLVLAVDADQGSAIGAPYSRRAGESARARRAGSPDRDIVEDEARDRVRRHRRQQDAVAVMAGGVDQTVERPGPSIGASSRLPGRKPTHISSIGSSSIAGTARHARLEQRQHAAGGERVVKAALLDGGADDEPAVAPRHEIGAGRPDDMA